jgi:hypothetical protein
MKIEMKRLCWRAALTLVGLYLASFVVFALFGGYMMLPSGYFRPFTLASADTFVWQPRFGTFYRFHTAMDEDEFQADRIGYLYAPLTVLLQHSIRPSQH